jgi:hypothetical protein
MDNEKNGVSHIYVEKDRARAGFQLAGRFKRAEPQRRLI